MRVLLLTQAFPPHPEVGAIRAANLVQAFREAGHEITVITEAVAAPPVVFPDAAGPAPRVIPVDPGPSHAQRFRALLPKSFRSKQPAGAAGAEAAAEPAQPGRLRAAVLAALSIPDGENHFIRPFYRAASRELERGADLLYSSGPPFSLHWCARKLRRRFGVPWVAEFRDPWQHPWTDRLSDLHPLTRGINARYERSVLASADLLVMATEAAREFTARKLPAEQQAKMLVARNGIPDWGLSARVPPTDGTGPFRIVHAGSFYVGRNPVGFFEGLALFLQRRRLGPESLQVELIGKCRSFQGMSMAALVARLELADFVHIEDWMPHAKARGRLLAADALLLFAQGQPLQVPNKLYEYLAVNRPVLAFVDREGESARILRDLPAAHLFYDGSAEQVADELERLIGSGGRRPGGGETFAPPEGLSVRVQMQNLVAEIGRRFGKTVSRHGP